MTIPTQASTNRAQEPVQGQASEPGDRSAGDRVDVSVLVPVLNEETRIRDTVRAMCEQRFGGRLEFLFADGRSDDRTLEVLTELAREDPRIRVLDNPVRRTPSGLNVCLREARGTYVARMDAHTFYPPDYIRLGVQRLQRDDVAWVSGPQVPHPVGRVSRAVALSLQTWLGRGGSRKWSSSAGSADEPATAESGEIELDTGVFTGVWRRDELLAHGGWDERWPSNQDAELAARFLERGQRIVCLPAMAARYIPRDDLKGLARQYWGYGFYRARTANQHPDGLRRSNLLAPGVALASLAAVTAPRRVRRLARTAMAGYAACVATVTLQVARRVDEPGDAATLPAVFVAMHLGNGFGFLAGFLRFGIPVAALAKAIGVDGLLGGRGSRAGAGEVFAPSLRGESA
jgi:glycosyltransferase involved in cell wall biosynthesis